MAHDLRDDMLECFCGNSEYKHYYYPKEKKIVYFPNDTFSTRKRCKFFFNNYYKNKCINKNCNFQHLKDDEIPFFSEKIDKYILNKNIYNVHTDKNKLLGWENRKSYNARDKRRIKSELPQYMIDEKNYKSTINLLESELIYIPKAPVFSPTTNYKHFFNDNSLYLKTDTFYNNVYPNSNFSIIEQPSLTADSEWFENRSRKIKVNNIGVIYYIKKTTGEKSWIHPYTGQTNLPGGHLTPSDAGLHI
jgi:hypothetical protein